MNIDDRVTCQICGQKYHYVSPKHLSTHGYTLAQYRAEFPDAAVRSQSALQTIANKANSTKGVARSDEVKAKMRRAKANNPRQAWNKGIPRSEEQKASHSAIMKSKLASGEIVHWNTGNTTPDHVKAKIANTALSQQRTYSEESKQKRLMTLDAKKLSGWIPPGTRRKGIKVTDPETLQKVRAASTRTNQSRAIKAIQQIQDICVSENLQLVQIEDNYWIHLNCLTCNTEFQYTRQLFRPCTKGGKELCPTCYPRSTGTSIKEQELANYVSSIYSGTIICNDRRVLNGKELDIYLPDLGIAFEFNGLYWHSENVHHGHKHHLLYKQQYAYKMGVRIINIFEDEWDQKRSVVESRIRHLLGVQGTRVHARQCTIKQINNDTKNEFLTTNHIMGPDVSKIRYGAYSGELLVAVMTFTPLNISKGGKSDSPTCELNRFAILQDYHIPGIASKMLKVFVADHNPSEIISYCDRRWNAGQSYTAMGFELVGTTPPSYWYMMNHKHRKHRSGFMKHTIVTEETAHMTEWEIMQQLGFDRIWDCGTLKFIWEAGCSDK